MKPTFAFLTLLVLNAPCLADCLSQPDTEITVAVKSCRVLDPRRDAEFVQARSKPADRASIDRFYRGALIVDEKGARFTYPSTAKNPCKDFSPGTKAKKMVGYTCCDTGPTGKCILGGVFLWDLGGKGVNTFQ